MEVIVNSDNFEEEVLKSDKPVLVDFFATWCGPCKVMAPVVEEIAVEQAGKLKVCVLDIDESDDIAEQYNVMSVPTIVLFEHGQPVRQLVGAQPKQALLGLFN